MTWQTVLPTLFTAIFAGFVGSAIEGRRIRRDERRKRLSYLSDDSSSGSWESVIYDIRDWATETRFSVQYDQSLADISPSTRCPGEHTLRFLVDHDRVPASALPMFLVLLDYCSLYNRALIACLTTDPPSDVRCRTAELGKHVQDLAQEIVHGHGREAALREAGYIPEGWRLRLRSWLPHR